MDPTLQSLTRFMAESAAARRDALARTLPPGWRVDDEGCVQLTTGWRFQMIPGGASAVGASEAEVTALTALTGELSPEAGELIAGVISELPPVRQVELAPLLLATEPLTEAIAERLGQIVRVPDGLKLSDVGAAEQALAALGLRLPSSAEWEHAYRAGTEAPFPWGATPPSSPWLPTSALGLVDMGAWPELCREGASGSAEHLLVKGGGAVVFPWQGTGEWLTLLSAYTSPATEHDGWLAVRPCVSLGQLTSA